MIWRNNLNLGFQWRLGVLIFALCVCASGMVKAQNSPAATEPTISQAPAKMDEAWRASSAKYDAKRNELLKEVKRAANEGPYRADWESLKTYEIPDWFRDAKFGIFIHWGL